jgi:hypothetical protein
MDSELGKPVRIGIRGERNDLEQMRGASNQIQRVLADRTRGAQNRDFSRLHQLSLL